jgi:hypothetical protein
MARQTKDDAINEYAKKAGHAAAVAATRGKDSHAACTARLYADQYLKRARRAGATDAEIEAAKRS